MVPLSTTTSCSALVILASVAVALVAAPLSQASPSALQDKAPAGAAAKDKAPAGAAAQAKNDEVTVIGCVVQLDRSAWRPGTSDSIPAGHPGQPASSGYALKDALVSTGDEPKSGPVATRSDREFGIAKGDVSVERFAGHQVVIKGRLTSTAKASEPASDPKRPSPGHDAMIEVTAVRTLSDSCPPRD